MAKKRAEEKLVDELEEDNSDLEEDEPEIVLPKIEKKVKEESEGSEEMSIDSDEIIEEDYNQELDLELEPEIPDYKHLNLDLHKGLIPNDYELDIIGQSHGFLNILVKHLLNTDGVKLAAYKITGIEPPKIFIRLEDGKKIKNILNRGIESLREEIIKVEKNFEKLM